MTEPTPVPAVPEPVTDAVAPEQAAEGTAPEVAPEQVDEVAAPEPSAEPVAVVPAPPMMPPPPPPPVAPVAAMAVGVPVFPNGKPMLDATGNPVSDKSRLAAALLCWFVGVLGIHRFYVGKVGTGILMLVTLGAFGIWALIDLVVILLGSFRDKSGKALQNW